MPIEIKKRMLNISLSGRISLKAWCPYSDSDITRPARNAPNASERPTSDVSHAVPKQINTILIRNNSRLCVLTMRYSIKGTTFLDTTTTMPTKTSAQRTFNATLIADNPDFPARSGISSTIATTLRSWKIKIPAQRRPFGESISPRSVSSLSTMAVLLIATKKPANTPFSNESPRANATIRTAPAVNITCRRPPANTVRLALMNSSSENSMPIRNNNRIIPTSASISISPVSFTIPSAEGPRSTPAIR